MCVCVCVCAVILTLLKIPVLYQTPPGTEKLKDLGNSILGNFGLSLDNFKTVQDPKTGSYNIQFEQNSK